MRTLFALVIVVSASGFAQSVTRSDTVVKTAGQPLHRNVGKLVEEVSIGVADGPREYQFTYISDLIHKRDGTVWVVDGHFNQSVIRRYDATGKYLGDVGRRGNGPGEYFYPQAAAELKDGRVVVLEFERPKLHVYKPDGNPDVDWMFRNTYRWIDNPTITVDTSGLVWIPFKAVKRLGTRENPNPPGPLMYLRVRPNGAILDSVPTPVLSTPYLTPYLPRPLDELSPLGYFVTGVNSRYAIDLRVPRPGSVWREGDPVVSIRSSVPVITMSDAERAYRKDNFQRSLSGPGGRSGVSVPDVPREKTPYHSFALDESGRVWVRISGPAERVTRNFGRNGEPMTLWLEPQRYDVFDASGAYVGRVELGERVRRLSARGDTLWGAVVDDDGVPQLKRYHIVW